MEDNEKWQNIIRKLMDKAEDNAVTPEEREAINERVTYLMVKYQLENIVRTNNVADDNITRQKYKMVNPYVNKKIILLARIAQKFGCKPILLNKEDFLYNDTGSDVIEVFGYSSDQERVFMLYCSLVIQMNTALIVAQALKPNGVHGKAFNNAFVNGFVNAVLSKIETAYKHARHDVEQLDRKWYGPND